MPLELSTSSALITGAGSGICLCFAKILLSKGCNVVIADLALRPEAKLVLDAHKDGPVRAIFQETDVTSWEQLQRAIDAGVSAFGSLELFCPGAGIFEPPFSNFWRPPGHPSSRDSPDSNHYKNLEINLTHPIRLTQLAISHMLPLPRPASSEQLRGAVVLISSVAAQLSPAFTAPMYAASKAGVSHFTRALAPLEKKHGIRVAAVAPGLVKTPMMTEAAEKLKMVDESKDLWVTPDEVAEAMLEVIMNNKYEAGTILEVGAKNTRAVKVLNDPGPGGEGLTASNFLSTIEDTWQELGIEGWGVVKK